MLWKKEKAVIMGAAIAFNYLARLQYYLVWRNIIGCCFLVNSFFCKRYLFFYPARIFKPEKYFLLMYTINCIMAIADAVWYFCGLVLVIDRPPIGGKAIRAAQGGKAGKYNFFHTRGIKNCNKKNLRQIIRLNSDDPDKTIFKGASMQFLKVVFRFIKQKWYC